MDTVTITMDVPKDILLAADIPTANAQAGIRKHLALYMFKERILSFGKASELSGMDKLSFMELAGSNRISFNYNTDAYNEDLKTIKDLKL
jgi:predicted HTH domain antitoxin